MKKTFLAGLTLTILIACFALSANATTIDTTVGGIDSVQIVHFGNTATDHYGQTFNIGDDTDTVLDSISFSMRQMTESAVTFSFNIYAWDGNSVTGSSLYTVSGLSTSGINVWDTFVMDDINLLLSNNTNYIFELDADNVAGGYAQVAATINKEDRYASGEFAHSNNDDPTISWTLDYWGDGDLAFVMETSAPGSAPVPEPATLLLLGAGLLGFGGMRKKAKK